jgi:hypothetical protein
MALTYSYGIPVGTPLPWFDLPDTEGRRWTPADVADARALVLVVTCNHCPYAIASEERLIALQREYGPLGVRMLLINPNDDRMHPEDSQEFMRARAAERSFPFPYLRDASQQTARALDAACTPDIFVFDGDRMLSYNGRIDDNWQDPSRVTREDLRRALDDTLTGKPIDWDVHPSVGCSIKWRN